MANAKKQNSRGGSSISFVLIVLCMIVGWIVWEFVMGNPANFKGGDTANQPVDGNILGMIYHGGFIVPILLGSLLTAIVFSIERFIALNKAAGKGNLDTFMIDVTAKINAQDIDGAIAACDKQQGTVANAIRAALVKSQEVKRENFDSEKASEMIQKEIEEATALEMPALEKNMTILSTLVSLGTLVGLLGTVSGMIKSFAALATSGAPDSSALANGISEALINTATGILTSVVAILAYSFFTGKIDTLTYSIDEAGSAIVKAYRRAKNGL